MSDVPHWVTLLGVRLTEREFDGGPDDWFTERLHTYRRTLREIAEEVGELVGRPIAHETVRRYMLTAGIATTRTKATS